MRKAVYVHINDVKQTRAVCCSYKKLKKTLSYNKISGLHAFALNCADIRCTLHFRKALFRLFVFFIGEVNLTDTVHVGM